MDDLSSSRMALLAAAKGGQDRAFQELLGTYRNYLQLLAD
jgi:hypothetical protein